MILEPLQRTYILYDIPEFTDFTEQKLMNLIHFLMINFDLCIRKGTFCVYYMDTKLNRGCGCDSNNLSDVLLELLVDIFPDLGYDDRKAIKEIILETKDLCNGN